MVVPYSVGDHITVEYTDTEFGNRVEYGGTVVDVNDKSIVVNLAMEMGDQKVRIFVSGRDAGTIEEPDPLHRTWEVGHNAKVTKR